MSPVLIDPHMLASAGVAWSDAMAAHAWSVWWRLGDPSGTTAEDATANNRDGTYNGSPTLGVAGLVSGDADTAVTFDGTDDFVSIANAAWIHGSSWSIVALVKKNGAPGASQHIVSRSSSGTPNQRHWFMSVESTGKARAVGYTSAGVAAIADGTTTITDNAAHIIVATCDGTTVRLYVDSGTAEASATIGGTAADIVAQVVTVGRRSSGGSFFAGTIDEVAYVSGVTLTDSQVGDLVSSFTGA